MPTIATTDRVDREALLDFVRERHNFTLMTTRRDGARRRPRSPAASAPRATWWSRRTPTGRRP